MLSWPRNAGLPATIAEIPFPFIAPVRRMATSTRSFMALVPTAAADSGNSNIADSKSVFRTFLYIADLLV